MIIVEVVERELVWGVVIVCERCEDLVVEWRLVVVKGIGGECVGVEIEGEFVEEGVGGGEEWIGGIVGVYVV